jgi:hypothetical protein
MRPILAVLVLPSAAFAQTIDFEIIPGLRGEAPEGLPIRDQFDVAPYHVRFEGLDPVLGPQPVTLAKVGAPRTAFRGESHRGCDGLSSDDDKPNRSAPFDAGCFFITDDGQWGTSTPPIRPFVVRYTVPVLQASGYVLDLDDQEEYTLHARDANDVDVAAPIVLDRRSGSGGNGGSSWWFFDVKEPIHSILFDYTGRGGSKGTGFDQFSPASACPGQVVHRGNGIPGSGGLVPAISMTCPQVGRPGSIEVFNGAGGAHGCLVVSLTPASRPLCGSTVLTDTTHTVPHILSGTARTPGAGQFSLPYKPLPVSMAGVTLYVQAGYVDRTASCRIAFTEVLEATVR